MLKQKALRKMLITSITVVILLMIYLMPTNSKTSTNILDVDKKIEYTQKDVGYIYLLKLILWMTSNNGYNKTQQQ